MLEDLGLQMNLHSTLGSYLERLIWLLTGHYGRRGTNNSPVPLFSLAKASKGDASAGSKRGPRLDRRSPVANAKIIIGLIPCNVIPEEILTDHPKRYRALLIQSGNPVHSLADSQRMREAMRALELSVVVDVAMTETAREADYVLPAASQFEKAEATFFNLEFPRNVFHLRQPLFEPLPGTLPEAEIYARLMEALGELSERDYAPLRRALRLGRTAFALAFFLAAARRAEDDEIRARAALSNHRSEPCLRAWTRRPRSGALPSSTCRAIARPRRGPASAASRPSPAKSCFARSSTAPRAWSTRTATTRTAGTP